MRIQFHRYREINGKLELQHKWIDIPTSQVTSGFLQQLSKWVFQEPAQYEPMPLP